MEVLWVVLGVVVFALIASNLVGRRDVPVEKMSDEMLVAQRDATQSWITRYHSVSNPSQDMREKYQYNTDRFHVIQAEIQRRRQQKSRPSGDLGGAVKLAEPMFRKYVEEISKASGLSPEGALLYAKRKRELYEIQQRGLGQDNDYAAFSALQRIISDKPMPDEEDVAMFSEAVIPKLRGDENPYERSALVKLREEREIMSEFGLSAEAFSVKFKAYQFSLSLHLERGWNDDIDAISRAINALSEEEIELAKTDFKRAILNRIIVGCVVGRSVANHSC